MWSLEAHHTQTATEEGEAVIFNPGHPIPPRRHAALPYVVTLQLAFDSIQEVGRYGFTRALMEKARLIAKHPAPAVVRVYNADRADIDCDAGRTVFFDGLIEDEREMVQAAIERGRASKVSA